MLVKDGGAFAMPGIHFGVVGQMEQTFPNALTELFVVASRKIGAADATTKECITSEHPTLNFSVETNTTARMARCADDFEGAPPDFLHQDVPPQKCHNASSKRRCP